MRIMPWVVSLHEIDWLLAACLCHDRTASFVMQPACLLAFAVAEARKEASLALKHIRCGRATLVTAAYVLHGKHCSEVRCKCRTQDLSGRKSRLHNTEAQSEFQIRLSIANGHACEALALCRGWQVCSDMLVRLQSCFGMCAQYRCTGETSLATNMLASSLPTRWVNFRISAHMHLKQAHWRAHRLQPKSAASVVFSRYYAHVKRYFWHIVKAVKAAAELCTC